MKETTSETSTMTKRDDTREDLSLKVTVPGFFLALSMVTCCLLSYGFGVLGRNLILDRNLAAVLGDPVTPKSVSGKAEYLPTPTVKGKIVPPTIYTTKNFDTRSSVLSSQWLKNTQDENQPAEEELRVPANVKLTPVNNDTDYEYDADEAEHLPAGQHLLIDINNVDGSFLNSEKELATAMLNMVDTSGLTLLSYHCHGLQPSGVTCVGVLLESHVSFHTWPMEGVITLDLFTCGSTSLLNHLQLIQNLFAVPRRNRKDAETPQVLWAYKRRGFNEQSNSAGSRDTFAYPLGIHGIESKQEIATFMTEQGKRGWVYDIHRSSQGTQYADVPSRHFYLDGVLKASSDDGAVSDESFVHPAMLAHPDPKNVLILGSTTGATVKEVLKHKAVDRVSLVGVDQGLLAFAKESLQSWNDCSEIIGITDSCLDDTRVEQVDKSVYQWLHMPNLEQPHRPSFDVILVDMFDLDEDIVRDILDRGGTFVSGLKKKLGSNGVVAFRVGGMFRSVDSKTTASAKSIVTPETHAGFLENLENDGGFVSQKQYKETFSGSSTTRSFVVAFTNDKTANNWNRNEAQVNRMIRERLHRTTSGSSPLLSFDGTTMVRYSKFQQDHHDCSYHPNPNWCDIQKRLKASKISSEHLIEELKDVEASLVVPTFGENSSINRLPVDFSSDEQILHSVIVHETS